MINELKHPLVTHKLSLLRSVDTGTKEFRELIKELTMLLIYEATKNIELDKCVVKTPLETIDTFKLNEDKLAFIPILRAGLGMIDGLLEMIPNAKIGHLGLARNEETLEPEEYYYKVPDNISNREVFILDPMLATGGSACACISKLKKDGVKKINFVCILAAPEGIKMIQDTHPDVDIYTSSIDRQLNEVGYILPGLGDAGDRIYGTKQKIKILD